MADFEFEKRQKKEAILWERLSAAILRFYRLERLERFQRFRRFNKLTIRPLDLSYNVEPKI